MTTHRYRYQHPDQAPKITLRTLPFDENVGHGDHWALVGADSETLQAWLNASLERATVPEGLSSCKVCDEFLVIGENTTCHIKQVFALQDGKPIGLVNVFPAINSPYGLECRIDGIVKCDESQDAILRLSTKDGTTIYAFDQLYAINHCHYEAGRSYYVNFAAWAYNIEPSRQDETILVDDPKAIRYHRAFNDIVLQNNGQVPADIEAQIKAWKPDNDDPLAPVEINLGHSCIYLFGETFGQEDEAWCQGQVLGISHTEFFGVPITLFDVAILREPNAEAFVVRVAAVSNEQNSQIQVQDYIQANIWLQVAIYAENQQAL